MSSQVGEGVGIRGLRVWPLLFVDDVDLLALSNIFNQHHQLLCLHFHCPHNKSQKLSHLQTDQACRQSSTTKLERRKNTPFTKRGSSKVQDSLWSLLKSDKAFVTISILYYWKKPNQNRNKLCLISNSTIMCRGRQMRGRDDAARFSCTVGIFPVRLTTPPQLSVCAISFSSSLLVLDLKYVYIDNSFYTLP